MGEDDVTAGAVEASRARRRPRLAGGRERRFYVKVSPDEAASLEGLAARRGVSVPRLLVEATLSGEGAGRGLGPAAGAMARPVAHPAVVTELTALSRALGRVGVNVNQIARATNATHEDQPGTDAALVAVEVVAARLGVLLDELTGTSRSGHTPRGVGE